MALVMGVAALDTYMHVLVYQRISENRSDMPKRLANLSVPLSDLAEMAEHVVTQRQNNVDARPWVLVKTALHTRLLRETFQSYENVSQAMAKAGIKKGWRKVAQKIGSHAEDIKETLNGIVKRRNQIVHESDYARLLRPQEIKLNAVDYQEVDGMLQWLEGLIDAIDEVRSAH